MKYDVLTIGDAMKDVFVFPRSEEMQKPLNRSQINRRIEGEKFLVFEFGDKITIEDVHYDIGGTACNVAAGMSKLGLKTGIIGCVGNDSEGENVTERLENSGVDTRYLKKKKDKKTSFSTIISYKGERTILVYHSFLPIDFDIPETLNTDWLYIGPQGEEYSKMYSKAISFAAQKNIKIALNPGSVQIKDGSVGLSSILRVTKILFINKQEAQKITNVHNFTSTEDLARLLKKMGPEIIVITDGKEGSSALSDDGYVKIGLFPGDRLDSTGAGDSFSSAFLAAYIRGEKIVTCLEWGAINSASVVGKIGAQEGLLTDSAIIDKISNYRWPPETFKFKQ